MPAVAAVMAVGAVAHASSSVDETKFGARQTVNDVVTGAPVIAYTVCHLEPSTDPIAHRVRGHLYEATVKVDAHRSDTPAIDEFIARADNGQSYPALAENLAPKALPDAKLAQGASSTGKVYFDVVGAVPTTMVFKDGTRHILAWTT